MKIENREVKLAEEEFQEKYTNSTFTIVEDLIENDKMTNLGMKAQSMRGNKHDKI